MTGIFVIKELYDYFKKKLIRKIKLSKKLSTKEKSDINVCIENLSEKELIELYKQDELDILKKLRG